MIPIFGRFCIVASRHLRLVSDDMAVAETGAKTALFQQ